MAACWERLAQEPDIDLHVIAHCPGPTNAFSNSLMQAIPCRLLAAEQANNTALIQAWVEEKTPDIVVITGWWLKAYRQMARALPTNTKVVLAIDTPWRHSLQWINRLRYYTYFRRINHVMVTGERSWVHARKLGFEAKIISRGMYGIDYSKLALTFGCRSILDWPKQFTFIGRYVPIKGLDVLLSAYSSYRKQVGTEPWNLVCCGQGPLRSIINAEGVKDLGFVQPDRLPQILAETGAFVLPSTYDPWPLALVEAAATGLPIVCTDACGSAVEVVRSHYNGLVVPAKDPNLLCDALLEITRNRSILNQWGKRSQELAAAYSTDIWVQRYLALAARLLR